MPIPTPSGGLELTVTRAPVDGSCPQCGQVALARYPVLSEGGWFEAVKCQQCLHTVSRRRGPLLGPVQLTSAGLVIE